MKRTSGAAALAALCLAGCGRKTDPSQIVASGHVEATDVRISTKVAGRLETLALQEGDVVSPGQELGRIDTTDLRLALQQAKADQEQASAEYRLRLAGARKEDIAELEATLESIEADLQNAQKDLDRMQGLLDKGSGTTKARDDARTRRDMTGHRRDATKEALARLRSGSRPEEKDSARARVASMEARIAQLEQQIRDATLASPLQGVVTEKVAEPGELLQVGSPVCVITDLVNAWLTVYVAGPDLGRIRLGQEAEVTTDDGQTRKGKVTFIASQAEFTPKNVQTRDERVKLVYKVKVSLQNQDGLFKPGMPSEARLRGRGHAVTGDKPLVVVEGLVRRYGERVAVNGVSFDVKPGEMFGLIGPDGAGKTTTLRVILGLLAATAGRVTTCGLDPIREGEALSRRIGYLSQRFSLYGDLTVDENVSFFASVHGVRGWRTRRDELLDMLRMTDFRTRLADRLSGGMKQKLALACTLIHTPELLVLDEPTTGVDPVSRRDFWRILARLQREGLTLLLTTPYLDEAERCQRVALMDKGHFLSLSTPDALRAEAEGAMVEILASPKRRAMEVLARMPEVAEVEAFGERLHASLPGVPVAEAAAAVERLARALAAEGVTVQQARATAPSLEDIFIARIRADESAGRDEVTR